MESQFTGNTKQEFHHKLENLFSKLDGMIEAIKSEPEEDRSWIPKAVESRSSWQKFQDALCEAGGSVARFGKAVVDVGSSVVEGAKNVAEFFGDKAKGFGSVVAKFF